MTVAALEKARRLIEADDVEWFDYCASRGHIPDNVKHLPTVQLDFARWLDGKE